MSYCFTGNITFEIYNSPSFQWQYFEYRNEHTPNNNNAAGSANAYGDIVEYIHASLWYNFVFTFTVLFKAIKIMDGSRRNVMQSGIRQEGLVTGDQYVFKCQ